jgi:hypothetical protein
MMWLHHRHQQPPHSFIHVVRNTFLSYAICMAFVVRWRLIVIECQPPTAIQPQRPYDVRTTKHTSKEQPSTTTTNQNNRNDINDDEYYVGIASHDM